MKKFTLKPGNVITVAFDEVGKPTCYIRGYIMREIPTPEDKMAMYEVSFGRGQPRGIYPISAIHAKECESA